MSDHDVIRDYDHHAEQLIAQYESRPFKQIHRLVLDLLPTSPAFILDVGAGSGRDPAWFAANGHEVVAVEPAYRLQAIAQQRHPDARIRWMADSLPALGSVMRAGLTFDLLWLSAVWMHVAPTNRARVFRKLVTLLKPGGQIMVTLRHGPAPAGRPMHTTSAEEIEKLARDHGLVTTLNVTADDELGREEVSWQTLWLKLPDDGLGALPLLRHIILNDSKASTYKLALLRVLVRIADSATGLVEDIDDETVAIPLGLVALYWIRAFKPLVESGVPQMPANRFGTGLGFVRAGFHGIRNISAFDLRLGARFTGQNAAFLLQAMTDSKNTITRMPANFITYPGKGEQVFIAASGRAPRRQEFTLDGAFLRAFGTLKIPRHLWQAMARYAPWIEPAILNEWTGLMRAYESEKPRSYDEHFRLLRWLDPVHDTAKVRALAEAMRTSMSGLHCVWTGSRLRRSFDVDHCFPFAAWPCNDLWNLMPAKHDVNIKKSDRLPSAETLFHAKQRILDWWGSAYLASAEFDVRFKDEASAALPRLERAESSPSADEIFDGVMMQRAVLKRDQQLVEWSPKPAPIDHRIESLAPGC